VKRGTAPVARRCVLTGWHGHLGRDKRKWLHREGGLPIPLAISVALEEVESPAFSST